MDFEFETKRTSLANAFAAAGADWLGYMGMTDTVVAEIPDTDPKKYAVAGTLKGILSMAGKMMGEEGAEQPTASEEIAGVNIARLLRNLEETSYNEGAMDLACRLSDCHAVIKALLAAPAAVSQPTGDLTDEQIRDAVQGIYLSDFQDNPEGYDIAIARAAIAAHLAAQKKADSSEA